MYVNACKVVPQRIELIKIGHSQPRTPMHTKNLAAYSVMTNNIHPRIIKEIGVHFHWLGCIDTQGQFRYYWKPVKQNLADHWTKHHSASHHREEKNKVFTPACQIELLRSAKSLVERERIITKLGPAARVCWTG